MSNIGTRRTFLKAGGALLSMLIAAPGSLVAAATRTINWRNWGGNQHSQPREMLVPRSEDEVVEMIRGASGSIRPVGSGHSWSALVPTTDSMMTLDRLSGLISHDANTLQAEVWAGTKLFAFGPMLEEVGQAVINMSDINYQTLAGAIATSTHGTGARLGSMSSYLTGMRLVTPSGEIIDCSEERETELFNAASTSLGALGVITRLKFQNKAKHRLHQQEWLADIDEVLEDIEPLIRDNEQFELFPVPNSGRTVVVVTNPAAPGAQDIIENDPEALNDLREAFALSRKLPVGENFVYNKVLDFSFGDIKHRIGPSYEVLAHPRAVQFMEMEYTVPAEQGVTCLREVLSTIKKYAPDVNFPLEYRYVKADETLIGMFSERDGCSISIHQYADDPNWKDYFALIEPIFHKFNGRPHWGKWHSLDDKQFSALYPHWNVFKGIRNELDLTGRMLNPHLRHLFGLAQNSKAR